MNEKNNTIVRKAVFPAAGLGTRFLPATKAMPKEMLPLVDKPLIQYAVEEAVQSGIHDICIVTGRGKTAIEDHFDVSFELEHVLHSRKKNELLETVHAISNLIDISYVRQKESLGLGHAVLRARNHVGLEPFVVILSDDVIVSETPCTRQLLDAFEQFGGPIVALMEVPWESVSSYGIVSGIAVKGRHLPRPAYRISDLVEKPRAAGAPSNLAIVGRYVLTPDVFGILETISPGHAGEIQLTDALRALNCQRQIYGVCFEGRRYDAGDRLGYLKACVELALQRDDLGRAFADYLSHLDLQGIPYKHK